MRHPSLLPSLADLAVLVAVAERGGVGAGARALGIAQPNASRALRRLEGTFGLALVVRGARGSTLTDDGALLVDWARDVLSAIQRLEAGVASLSRGSGGTLRIAASQTIAEALLPRWLAGLRAEDPEVAVALTVGNSDEVARLVNEGAVLGLVESPGLPGTLATVVSERLITTDRLTVVVAPGHDWARRTRPIDLAELLRTPLVVREPGSGTRVSLEQAVRNMPMARPALELSSNAAVRLAVAAGVAPAVLSEHAVQVAVSVGELRAVMVEGLVVERPLRAIWSTDRPPPPAALRLVDLATSIEARRSAPPAHDPGWGL